LCEDAAVVSLAQLVGVAELGLLPRHLADPDAALRWVATSELPDPSPFLEGGEVLLTTGLETSAGPREWSPYVRRLASAGVVAIGFGVGLTHEVVPAALLSACELYGVSLFEVPRETTFVAISRAAAGLLQDEEESATRRAFELQRELTQAALHDDEPEALLRRIASIGVMACTVTAGGVAELGPFGGRPELFEYDEVQAMIGRVRARGLKAAATFGSGTSTLMLHPLGVRGRPERYLVTGFAGRITELQRNMTTTAVALLSLDEERRRELRTAARGLRARALQLLLTGDHHTASLVVRTSPAPRPKLPDQACVLRASGPEDSRDQALQRVESESLLAGLLADELVVIAPAPRSAALAAELSTHDLRVGIGAPGPLAEVRRSAETASYALDMTHTDSPVAAWEQSVDRGVLSLIDDDRAAAYSTSFLAALGEGAQREVLLETLRSFLLHHGSHLKVAADLGIHRNTVRHRLTQLETALGRSLADPQTRMNAWAALTLAERPVPRSR
jgi:PucR family transcriptional regulator, purine catabolism regulatory protein